jgi:hypothetical protein
MLAVVAALLAWLWPIGIGGKMPVGGDVTQFFLGLMGVFSESLREGRLPAWNDLWGFGFPGLAESQMGVYYPVHVVLYRWLNTETAYVVSMVVHTLWGGVGAFWAARRLGISSVGAALAAFSWSASGFFLIHLAHPWGYTTGCWMPWAWGLAWCILKSGSAGGAGQPLLLSLVLVLQILPGHFQLAFLTQSIIVLTVLWAVIEAFAARARRRPGAPPSSLASSWRGAFGVVLAMAAVFPLAALQLWPTARLAQLAAGRRDFEYLSGFASPPFHLVNYVAPGLFHRSPLWRPLVWDPFHAMPEEHLPYVGLIPLFLACATIVRESRRDASVRMLAILVAATIVLSLGPYAPGFRYLIMLPGFSFFRAPSRWSLATALALAFLAGKGFDRWPSWTRAGRSLRRFAFVASVWVVAIVILVELALMCATRPGWPRLTRSFQAGFAAMPWAGDPGFDAVVGLARRPMPERHLPPGLPQSGRSFASDRMSIYWAELWESGVLVSMIMIVATLTAHGRLRPKTVQGAFVLITILDLVVLGRHRLIGVGPLRPLREQSPVLARVAENARGTRIANGALRNLPMLLGMAPISAYRTLDLPAVPQLTSMAQGPLSDPIYEPEVLEALRATGTGLRVFDPLENRVDHLLRRTIASRETVEDPALASWLLDPSWLAGQGSWAREFTIWHSRERPARAWLIRAADVSDPSELDLWSGDPREILAVFRGATPLATESPQPEEWTISVTAEGRAWVLVSQLADPQWRARWLDLTGPWANEPEILPTFRKSVEAGGWQRIEVPGPGRWRLRLEYDTSDIAFGLAVSTVAWTAWMMAAFSIARRSARDTPGAARRNRGMT